MTGIGIINFYSQYHWNFDNKWNYLSLKDVDAFNIHAFSYMLAGFLSYNKMIFIFSPELLSYSNVENTR